MNEFISLEKKHAKLHKGQHFFGFQLARTAPVLLRAGGNLVSAWRTRRAYFHYFHTDKTTRCVIRSLRGRGLWLGGKSNHSINQSANQSITQSIHQLNKQSVEIICWYHLLRLSVKTISWDQLLRFVVEINCWDYLLRLSAKILCCDQLLRLDVITCRNHLLRLSVKIIWCDQLLRLSVAISCWDYLLR